MNDRIAPSLIDMADLPMQTVNAPANAAQARARFFNSGNAFNVVLPPVPARIFDDVARRALAATASAWFDCDQSAQLGCPFPATTPLVLARYGRVAPNDSLHVNTIATCSIGYVIEGEVRCSGPDVDLLLAAGDVVLLPGGADYRFQGAATGGLLWIVGDEPRLAFDGLRPFAPPHGPIEVVHFPAAEIERQMKLIIAAGMNDDTAGRALIFASERHEAGRNLTPTLTLAMNTLSPRGSQRAHRHNSVAVTLIVQGRDCHSMVDGERCEWVRWATMVTPPGAPHSHHSEGDERALFLIVQDGGLHYHARTMGFAFLDR